MKRCHFWWGYLGVVLLVTVGAVASAFAQSACGTTWELQAPAGSAGSVVDHGAAGDVCASESARIVAIGIGLTISACTASGTSMSYHLNGAGGVDSEDRTWLRLPLGCEAGGPEPLEYVSTVPNLAPLSVLLPMVCAFLALIWWVIFK